MGLKKYVLLECHLEKDVPNLKQQIAQLGWSIDGMARCEHVNIDAFGLKVVGEVPDELVLVSAAVVPWGGQARQDLLDKL